MFLKRLRNFNNTEQLIGIHVYVAVNFLFQVIFIFPLLQIH